MYIIGGYLSVGVLIFFFTATFTVYYDGYMSDEEVSYGAHMVFFWILMIPYNIWTNFIWEAWSNYLIKLKARNTVKPIEEEES